MWCLSRPNGARFFHPTEDAANAARDALGGGLVWFDAFDYDRYTQGRAA